MPSSTSPSPAVRALEGAPVRGNEAIHAEYVRIRQGKHDGYRFGSDRIANANSFAFHNAAALVDFTSNGEFHPDTDKAVRAEARAAMSTPSPVAPVAPATPLPWRVNQSASHVWIDSKGHGLIAEMQLDDNITRADKDAAYLCAAANAYPALLKWAKEACENERAYYDGDKDRVAPSWLIELEAAVKAAEGK